MTRALASLLLAATIAATGSAAAEDARRESNVIMVATHGDPTGDAAALARCAFLAAGDASQGGLAHVVAIAPHEADGATPFALLDGQMGIFDGLIDGPADFDVTFYEDLGTCVTPADERAAVRFASAGNEHGLIPAGARYAVVTVKATPGASFQFMIGPE